MPAKAHDGRAPKVSYRAVSVGDLDQVVSAHRQAFPESAVSQLGPAVVDRYYRWQLTGPHPDPYALGAWRDAQLVGFVFGGLRFKAVAGFARGSLGTIAIGALTHPRALRRLALPQVTSLARLMVYRRPRPATARVPAAPSSAPASTNGQPVREPAGPSFGILSIAVLPTVQGSGVANELMAQAKTRAVERGFAQMNLTVQIDNARAIAFYEKRGWERRLSADAWGGAMRLRLDRS